MLLKKITLIAALAFVSCAGMNCSTQETKDQYAKFYGKGRAERDSAGGTGSFAARSDNDDVFSDRTASTDLKVNPDSINSLSVTENADSEQGTSTALTQGKPEPAGKTVAEVSEKKEAPKVQEAPKQKPVPADIAALLNKNTCSACHQAYTRVVGPAYSEVAKKNYTTAQIVALVYEPKPEHWPGYPPMMAMPQVPKGEVEKLAKWINTL